MKRVVITTTLLSLLTAHSAMAGTSKCPSGMYYSKGICKSFSLEDGILRNLDIIAKGSKVLNQTQINDIREAVKFYSASVSTYASGVAQEKLNQFDDSLSMLAWVLASTKSLEQELSTSIESYNKSEDVLSRIAYRGVTGINANRYGVALLSSEALVKAIQFLIDHPTNDFVVNRLLPLNGIRAQQMKVELPGLDNQQIITVTELSVRLEIEGAKTPSAVKWHDHLVEQVKGIAIDLSDISSARNSQSDARKALQAELKNPPTDLRNASFSQFVDYMKSMGSSLVSSAQDTLGEQRELENKYSIASRIREIERIVNKVTTGVYLEEGPETEAQLQRLKYQSRFP